MMELAANTEPSGRRVVRGEVGPAVAWIQALRQDTDLRGECAETLSVSCPDAPPGQRLVQTLFAEQVAVLEMRSLERPVLRIDDAKRGGGHDPVIVEDDTQQIRFRLDARREKRLSSPFRMRSRSSPLCTIIRGESKGSSKSTSRVEHVAFEDKRASHLVRELHDFEAHVHVFASSTPDAGPKTRMSYCSRSSTPE